jgi:hypothetical protein
MMELEQFIPERVKWEADVPNSEEKLTLFFRLFNLEDESWLKRTYGDKLDKVFSELQTAEISKIAFHQLELDSKRSLMSVKFLDMDEEGKDIEVAKTGPEKVAALTVGAKGITTLIDNLLKTRGLSLPLLEKIVQEVGTDGLEKLMAHGKNQTGSKSST